MSYKYILGILNSRVVDFFIKQKSPMFSGGYYKYHTQHLEQIPIVEPKPDVKNDLIRSVQRMLDLNLQLNSLGDKKTSDSAKIDAEIKKTDAEIDSLVYGIYGLTEEEIRIVEEFADSSRS